LAESDISVKGTVSGSYSDTHISDDVYQVITEVYSRRRPFDWYSMLVHKWVFNVTPGTNITFYVEAYRPDNGDGDNFSFEYSTDNVNFAPLVTVHSDVEQLYSAPLPNTVGGIVYIRVADTNHTRWKLSLDPVYIDYMYIQSESELPPPEMMSVHPIDVTRIGRKANRH
jgi:hypothetical protein